MEITSGMVPSRTIQPITDITPTTTDSDPIGICLNPSMCPPALHHSRADAGRQGTVAALVDLSSVLCIPLSVAGSGYLPFMAIRSDQGIVLRGYPFGESHRVVVLMSPNHGKLRTVAKGVRKTKSRFGGRLEPMTHVDLVLYEGKNLDTITQVSVIDGFPNLRNDLDRVLAAGTMIEVVDAVVQEDDPSLRMFLLLQRGLKVLDDAPPHPDLVTAFLLKAADILGMAPALDSCAGCGSAGPLKRFSFSEGGSVCESCRTAGAYALRDGVVPYLAKIAVADITTLPPSDPSMTKEALGITKRFMEYHLERRLESLAVPNV